MRSTEGGYWACTFGNEVLGAIVKNSIESLFISKDHSLTLLGLLLSRFGGESTVTKKHVKEY